MGTLTLLIGLYLMVVLAMFWSEIVFKMNAINPDNNPDIDDQTISIKDNIKSFVLTFISLLAFGFIFVPMLLCTLVVGSFEKFRTKKYKKVLVVDKNWKPGYDLDENPHKYLKHVYRDATLPRRLKASRPVLIHGNVYTIAGTRKDGVLIVIESGE